MTNHPLKSHEIYLLLCRMDNRGLASTEEYRLLREIYSLVIRREQAQMAVETDEQEATNADR